MWVVRVSEVRLICIGKLPEHFSKEENMYICMYNVALGATGICTAKVTLGAI